MSKFTIEEKRGFRLLISTSGKRFHVYTEKYGLFAKIFIPENKRCIADSFQISLLEAIIFASNNGGLTRRFWIANGKKLPLDLMIFLGHELKFLINGEFTADRLFYGRNRFNESFSEPEWYNAIYNTPGYAEPTNYPSIDFIPTSPDSSSSSSNYDDNSSSSSSFDFGGGDTGGGGAGGDY